MLPKALKNFNLFVDGVGYAGRIEEFTLPKLTRKLEEWRGGGMNGSVDIDMGMEKMETELSLREYTPALLTQYGICDVAGTGLRFRGAAVRDDESCETDAIEIVMRGRFKEIDFGSNKSGDATTMKISGSVNYFKYTVNDEVLIEIDLINMIEIVGGVDRLAEQRNALGI